MFLIGITGGDVSHPLVPKIRQATKMFEVVAATGSKHIHCRIDFALHPVYQTKWLKYGLDALKLPDVYTIPKLEKMAIPLCSGWTTRTITSPVRIATIAKNTLPWLGIDHFHGVKNSPIGNRDYPPRGNRKLVRLITRR